MGPRWEVNEQGQASVDDAGFQRTLLCFAGANQVDQFKQWSDAVQKLQGEGIPVQLVAYKGGPSGYILDRSKQGLAAASEVYGESLAMAVAAFDAQMNAYRLGWTYQNSSAFAEGHGWSSHTDLADGFRPEPAWLAMEPTQ